VLTAFGLMGGEGERGGMLNERVSGGAVAGGGIGSGSTVASILG